MNCGKCKEKIDTFKNVSCPCCSLGIIKVCEDCFDFIEYGDNPLTIKDITN